MSAATVLSPTSPTYWQTHANPGIRRAVKTYLCTGGELTAAEVSAIRLYLRRWIDRPWYQGGEPLRLLREGIQRIQTRDDVRRWLQSALVLGIDPL